MKANFLTRFFSSHYGDPPNSWFESQLHPIFFIGNKLLLYAEIVDQSLDERLNKSIFFEKRTTYCFLKASYMPCPLMRWR